MKIEFDYTTEPVGPEIVELTAFAEAYDLTMKLGRHAPLGTGNWRYTARFAYAEVKDGPMLVSSGGDGATEARAIADYARKISGKLLVIYAMDETRRREIRVPQLVVFGRRLTRRCDTDAESDYRLRGIFREREMEVAALALVDAGLRRLLSNGLIESAGQDRRFRLNTAVRITMRESLAAHTTAEARRLARDLVPDWLRRISGDQA